MKSLADFYCHKNGKPYAVCKRCHLDRTSRNAKKSPERRAELQWKYRGVEGFSWEQYEQMMQEQDSVCAICDRSCGSGRRLAVDHNHGTGKVRGLLCQSCNQTVGKLENGTIPLGRLVTYLKEEITHGSLTHYC